MPPPSPQTPKSGKVTWSVMAGGSSCDDCQLQTMEIVTGLNRIPYARVEFLDGNPAKDSFALASGTKFAPGTTLEIQLGYEGTNTSVFSGVVTKQSLRRREDGQPLLIVEARDKAVKMTITRRSVIYTDPTDADILKKVIQRSNLTAKVDSTTPALKTTSQYLTTDWDFLVSRAEANGLVVYVSSGTVNVSAPDPTTDPVLTLNFGADVLDYRLDEDAPSQFKAVQCTSWDFVNQALVQASASNDNENALGSPSSSDLAAVASPDQVLYQSSAPLQNDALTAWAKGLMLRSELAKIRGDLTFQGSALIAPGKTIALTGFSTRFDGTAFISAVTHTLNEHADWRTKVEVGFDETRFIETVPASAPMAGGLLPGVTGLQNGVVKKIDADPDGAARIQVNVVVMGKDVTIWARFAMPYATNQAGICFYPEVGDEVIIGFVNDDPTYPVVLGCLYSNSKKAPPQAADDKNTYKTIKTTSGLTVQFDDVNAVLTLSTKAKNSITVSDKAKSITLQDQNGNSIVLDESGVTIKSNNKQVSITGQTGISATATSGDISLAASAGAIKGSSLNVSLDAQAQFEAKAAAAASLQASGELTIKGAMVMIN